MHYQGLVAAASHQDDDDDDGDDMNGADEEAVDGDSTLDNKLDPTLKLTDRTTPSNYSDSVVGREEEDENNNVQSNDPNETDELSTDSSTRPITTHAPAATAATVVCGVKITKRHWGMLSAVFCGVWGGSIMAPMKWCKSDTKGTHYLLSFAIGASIVTLALWLLRYLWNVVYYQSFSQAYYSLPSFHVKVMWLPGGISGLLWSIGMGVI